MSDAVFSSGFIDAARQSGEQLFTDLREVYLSASGYGRLFVGRRYGRLHILKALKPEYAGGSVLDVGVYPVSFSQMLLGTPKEIKCSAKIADGIDYSDEITLVYDGAVCELTCTFEGLRSFKGVIEGEKGKIVISNYTRPKKAVIYGENGEKKRTIRGKRGYVYEFDALADSVRRGELKSRFVSPSDTVEVMKILDECRRQTGLVYPEKVEKTR